MVVGIRLQVNRSVLVYSVLRGLRTCLFLMGYLLLWVSLVLFLVEFRGEVLSVCSLGIKVCMKVEGV